MKVILALSILVSCACVSADSPPPALTCPSAGHMLPDPTNLCIVWECVEGGAVPIKRACPKGTRVPTWWEGGSLNMCFVRNIVEHGGEPTCHRCQVNDAKIDDSCASGNNPCPTGCKCIDVEHTHRCDCPFVAGATVDWTPSPIAVDHCSPNPCKNGASCENHWDDYFCFCPAKFTGKNCDIPICEWNPCQNGGTCEVDQVGFHCICTECWIGSCCNVTNPACGAPRPSPPPASTPSTPTVPEPTQNPGEVCPPCKAWNGTACIEAIRSCECMRCEPSLTCVMDTNGPACVAIQPPPPTCPTCTTGAQCEQAIRSCECTVCRPGFACVMASNGPECVDTVTPQPPPTCPTCTTGAQCEQAIRSCECTKCEANMVCVIATDGPACVPIDPTPPPTCPKCTAGAYCEPDLSRCECNNPCKQGEVCSDGLDPKYPAKCEKSNEAAGERFTFMFEENNTEQPKPEIPLEVYVTPSQKNSGSVPINIKSAGLSPGDHCYFNQNLTVPENDVLRIPVERCMRHNGTGLQNLAIRVTVLSGDESKRVTVYGINRDTFSADGFLAFPDKKAGTNFQTVSYSPAHIASQFGVVALEDGTTVTIHLADDNDLPAPDNVKGSVVTVTMKAFQTFQVQARCSGASTTKIRTCNKDLTGSIISSNKPVHVFSGNVRASIPGGIADSRDHLVEQLLPTNRWGKQFGIMGVPNRVVGDLINIMALKDRTTKIQIFKSDGTVDTFDLPLNGKSSIFKELDSGARTFIKADEPIYVTMYTKSRDNYLNMNEATHDPSAITIPSVEQFTNNFFISTPSYSGGGGAPRPYDKNLVLLVARSGDESTIKVDGNTPNFVSNWAPLPKGSDANDPVLVGAVAKLKHGTSLIESSGGNFQCLVYGHDDRESYGFPVAMNFKVTN